MEMTLAENIRTLRKNRSLTQEQLAEILGVTPGAVYKWEAKLSVPELPMLLELADYFDTSVDALLGYRIRNNSLKAVGERINACLRNGDPAAMDEAEKALKKYPNSFAVVHGCAEVYYSFGSVDRHRDRLRRALALFEKALLLIAQNTDPHVSEYTINGEIGRIYIMLGEPERGLELLKKHNSGGMFDDVIGITLAAILRRPEEAEPYLFESLLHAAAMLQTAVEGYAFCCSARGDHGREAEAVSWGLELLERFRRMDEPSYLDKTNADLLLLLSHARLHGDNPGEARETLDRAAALARQFDTSPYFGVAGFPFATGAELYSIHDGLGKTAAESAEFILKLLQDPELGSLWKEAMDRIPGPAEDRKEENP